MFSSSKNPTFSDYLKSELVTNNAKMCYQQKEVSWTKLTIENIEDILNQHKLTLNNLLAERGLMVDEREYVKSLHGRQNSREDSLSDLEDESSLPQENTQNSDLLKIALFNEDYELLKVSKPQDFYRAIRDRLLRCVETKTLWFRDQTFIPNDLKVSTDARTMVLYKIDSIGEYPLNTIVSQSISTPIDLHISTGAGELLSLRGDEPHIQFQITAIKSPVSYSLLQCQITSTRLILLVNSAPMILAIEIHSKVQEATPKCSKTPAIVGHEFTIPKNVNKHQASFLVRDLPLKEVRSRLMFVDVQFAKDVHGCMVPIDLTVIDYQGSTLINAIICPRTQIKNYGQEQHGLTEQEVLGKSDSYKIMTTFYNVIDNKIIVGHDLRKKLEYLKVDLKCLYGIRELQASSAMKKLMNDDADSWNLDDISTQILKQPFKKCLYSTEQSANLIRKVYIAIESHWRDSVSKYDSNDNGRRSSSASGGSKSGVKRKESGYSRESLYYTGSSESMPSQPKMYGGVLKRHY